MERCIELLNSQQVLESTEGRRLLFNNPTYKPYLLITYNEFRKLFKNDENNITKFNKMIIYTEVDYYNYVYNQTWSYKWYPLLFKFVYNCLRFKPTSFGFSLFYLYSIDFLLEKFCLFQYVDDKIIDVSEYFTAQLSKEKYQKKQNELFLKYRNVVLEDIKEKHYVEEYKPREWILMGNKFNIYNPYIHWTETRDQDAQTILKQFFIQNSQVLLFIDRIQRLFQLVKVKGIEGLQKESRATVQHYFSQIKRIIYEFPIYKQYVPYLHSYNSLEEMLSSPYIDQRKRYIQLDEIKLIGSKFLNLFNYMVYGKCEFIRYEFKWFDPNISAKKPQFKVERLLYDVIPFAVLCILPTKLIGFRKNIENARRYANYIGQTFGPKIYQK